MAEMAAKQKVMLVLTVVMFLGVIYMIYSMFFSSPDYSAPAPAPAASAPAPQAAAPQQTMQTAQPAQMAPQDQMTQQGQMGQPGQMTQQGQMGQPGQMTQQGQMGQPGQMTQQGQMGQPGQMTQQGQMGQPGQMTQQGQMGQPGQMNPQGQMGQPGQMNPQGQMGQSDQTYQQPPAVTVMAAPDLTPEQMQILQQQQEIRDKYLSMVNQYQMTEMQQKVAQAKVGLYQSQLAAGKTVKEAQDLGIPLDAGPDDNSGATATHYSVAFIGLQNGTWSAMISAQGQYINVKVGSSLPDGSVVSQISSTKVTLFKDGDRRYLMLPVLMDKSDEPDAKAGGNTGGAKAAAKAEGE